MCSTADSLAIREVVEAFVAGRTTFDAYDVAQALPRRLPYREVFVEVATAFRKDFGARGYVAVSASVPGSADRRQVYVYLGDGCGTSKSKMANIYNAIKPFLL